MRKQEIAHSLLALVLSVGALGLLATHNFLRADMTDAVALYVSPTGNDSDDGSEAHPFLTITAAKTKTRQLRSGGQTGPITVYLREGRYFQESPLAFTVQDSGTAPAPTTYKNYAGEEAVITGSKILTEFSQVSDPAILARLTPPAQAAVQVVNLPSQGITNYGVLERRGGFIYPEKPDPLVLFVNGERQKIASYPNYGSWDTIASVIDTDPIDKFTYTSDFPASWAGDTDMWVSGFFYFDWADSHLHVSSIDPATKTVTLDTPYDSYGVRANQWFRFENILGALDSPGEYYLDRGTGNLYLWPTTDLTQARVTASMTPTLATINSARYLNFGGITFEGARGNIVTASNSSYLKFTNSAFIDGGNSALYLNGVTNTIIATSIINQIAERGIYIKGGDRNTLTSSSNVIINNLIHDTNRWVETNRAAIEPDGVGIRMAHNEFYNQTSISIRYAGNDHLIEYNSFHDVVQSCSNNHDVDGGVIYTGRNYTFRGNVMRFNSFKDICVNQTSNISGAIYLDDAASGDTAFGNFFDNVGTAFMVGGGRDNLVDNNVIVNTKRPMYFDSRGFASETQAEWMSNRYYNAVTDATNTTPIVITLAKRHGIGVTQVTKPKTMDVTGVTGNTAANGTWNYEIVSPNQLRLLNSVGNGDYAGGGDAISTGSLFHSQIDALNRTGPYNKYPDIFNYTKYTLGEPLRNIFNHNIIYFGNKPAARWITMYASTPPFLNFTNGVINGSNNTPEIPPGNSPDDPQFVNPGAGDYRVQASSPARTRGFQELPYERMGRLSGDKLLVKPQNQTVEIPNELRMTITAPYFTDEATNPTYTFDSLPNGASFNRQTRTLTWIPEAFQVGTYDFVLTVSDDYLTATTSFSVTVTSGGRTGGGNSGTATATPTPTTEGTGALSTDTATPTAQVSNTATSVVPTAQATSLGRGTTPKRTSNSSTPGDRRTSPESSVTSLPVNSPTSGTSVVKSNTQENLVNTAPVETVIEQQEQSLSRAARALTAVLTIVVILDLMYLLIWAGRLILLRIRARPEVEFPPEVPPQI